MDDQRRAVFRSDRPFVRFSRMAARRDIWVCLREDCRTYFVLNCYRLQLVKHIYSEHLLNKEHYLDWIITSFHDSDLNLLPSWFLVLQGHFDAVTHQIPLGRRLVKALLEQLYKVCLCCGQSEYILHAYHRCVRPLMSRLGKFVPRSVWSYLPRYVRLSCHIHHTF